MSRKNNREAAAPRQLPDHVGGLGDAAGGPRASSASSPSPRPAGTGSSVLKGLLLPPVEQVGRRYAAVGEVVVLLGVLCAGQVVDPPPGPGGQQPEASAGVLLPLSRKRFNQSE